MPDCKDAHTFVFKFVTARIRCTQLAAQICIKRHRVGSNEIIRERRLFKKTLVILEKQVIYRVVVITALD
ncbi:MAG: hypothetical protein LBT89_03975 [Planctomycetaceae bacterium]|nr:hypothetical protein [Planctomycetaceae bacterium]